LSDAASPGPWLYLEWQEEGVTIYPGGFQEPDIFQFQELHLGPNMADEDGITRHPFLEAGELPAADLKFIAAAANFVRGVLIQAEYRHRSEDEIDRLNQQIDEWSKANLEIVAKCSAAEKENAALKAALDAEREKHRRTKRALKVQTELAKGLNGKLMEAESALTELVACKDASPVGGKTPAYLVSRKTRAWRQAREVLAKGSSHANA